VDKRVEDRTVREVMTRTPTTVGPRTDVRTLKAMFALWAERAEDVMSRGLVTVTPEDRVATAIDLMVQSRLRSLPVVEQRGRQQVLVGIVSRSDVLRCLMLEADAGD
jgi:CBS domain-containing protein